MTWRSTKTPVLVRHMSEEGSLLAPWVSLVQSLFRHLQDSAKKPQRNAFAIYANMALRASKID